MTSAQSIQTARHGNDQGEQEERWETLLLALEDFAAVQEEHAACLAAGRVQNIMTWRDRRQRAFARLVQCFEAVEGGSVAELPGGQDLVSRVMERLSSLLAGEKGLATAAERQHAIMDGQIKAMRKGRKALRGYAPGPVVGAAGARFLSSKS